MEKDFDVRKVDSWRFDECEPKQEDDLEWSFKTRLVSEEKQLLSLGIGTKIHDQNTIIFWILQYIIK